jgi:hypothetical protein
MLNKTCCIEDETPGLIAIKNATAPRVAISKFNKTSAKLIGFLHICPVLSEKYE